MKLIFAHTRWYNKTKSYVHPDNVVGTENSINCLEVISHSNDVYLHISVIKVFQWEVTVIKYYSNNKLAYTQKQSTVVSS